jgi:hypothetical protein
VSLLLLRLVVSMLLVVVLLSSTDLLIVVCSITGSHVTLGQTTAHVLCLCKLC